MHRICSSLSQSGYSVLLVGRQKVDSIAFSHQNFNHRRIRCWFDSSILFYAEYNIRLLWLLIKMNPDFINSVDLDTLAAGRVASWLRGCPLTFDAHELFTELPELEGRPITREIWKIVQRAFLKGRVEGYTVNQSVATQLQLTTGKTFSVIHNFPVFKDHIPHKSPKPKAIRLVYQGVLNVGRGIEEVINAVGSIADYEFHIIGKGDEENNIKQLSSKHENVYLHGFVAPQVLHQMTSQFDIGINLLTGNSQNYYYSSANKFFDYIMAGIPVISMDFPEYQNVNKRFNIAVLLKDTTGQDILGAIKSIMTDYTLYSARCIEASKELHWANEEKKLLALYQKLS